MDNCNRCLTILPYSSNFRILLALLSFYKLHCASIQLSRTVRYRVPTAATALPHYFQIMPRLRAA